MEIAVIGTGYVGLVAGACFSDTGNTVTCVDKDLKKVEALKRGEIPIYEPGLEVLVERGVKQGRLHFTSSTAEAVARAQVIFMAVGTPSLPNGDVDMSYVKAASEEVGAALNGYKIVVNKSTVPIGSHKTVAEWIRSQTQHEFDVVSNPEFLKEGSAIDDFLKPDRVVVGTHKESVYKVMQELYAPFVRQGNPVIWMDPYSAEITKYACNTFLATRISFMNELSRLCEAAGGDVEMVRRGMASDVRIGKHFLYAGVGYGGSCFPKDVKGLISTAKKLGIQLEIADATESANAKQKKVLVQKVQKVFGDNLHGKTFGIWGIAFKPNTDDIREAPALVVIEELIKMGARIQAFDPVAMKHAASSVGSEVLFTATALDAAKGADALLIITEWNEFRHPDLSKLKTALKQPLIFDGRNIYEAAKVREAGFQYYSIGRN